MPIFVNFEEEKDEFKFSDLTRPSLFGNDLLDHPVDELKLSIRLYNCLKNADIRSIQDLILDGNQKYASRNGTRFRYGFRRAVISNSRFGQTRFGTRYKDRNGGCT